MKNSLFCTLALLLFFSFSSYAQNDFSSEKELKEKAAEYFEQGKLVEASPLYSQLLSLYPKDATYNYRYGACLLASDGDKEKAMKYLKFSTSKPNSDPLAYYYLGRAYHLNYNFADAVKQYTKFKNKGSSDLVEKFQVERKIEMCKNGNDLLSRLNEVQVLEKQVISQSDFFRIYDLEGIDGKIITTPSDFLAKEDEKRNEKSILYLPPQAKEVYYASYGKKGENGKDIYKRVLLGNGNWSDGVPLGNSINTPYDEDYPFIHPDGRTLYFASKGHSSMGGYDLFMSTYDESVGDWTAPVNLDFAFSSVDDDILFITDQDKVLAYFASNRTNKEGEITVYKVLVEKAPADLSVIRGKFIAENDPNLKKAKITVINKTTNQTVGVYETDNQGNYQIEIPSNGGEYKFNLETTDEAPIHQGLVTVPKQESFEVLGQELRLTGEGDNQTLVIKNIFDGSSAQNRTYAGPVVSSEVLRKKANLEVNLKPDQLAAITSGGSAEIKGNVSDSSPTNKGNGELPPEKNTSTQDDSNAQESTSGSNDLNQGAGATSTGLVAQIDAKLNQQEEQHQEIEAAAALAYNNASEASKNASSLFEQAENESDTETKEATLKQAIKESAKAQALTELAKELDNFASADEKELEEVRSKAEQYKAQAASGTEPSAEEIEALESKPLGKYDSVSEFLEDYKSQAQTDLKQEGSKLNELAPKASALNAEYDQISQQLSDLRGARNSASGSEKKSIDTRISELKLDSSDRAYQKQQVDQSFQAAVESSLLAEMKSQQVDEISNAINNNEQAASESFTDSQKSEIENELQTQAGLRSKAWSSDANIALALAKENSAYDADAIASNSSGTVQPNQTNSSSSNITEGDETLASEEFRSSFDATNQKYETQISALESSTDESQSNSAKLGVYQEWNKELESQKSAKESSMANSNPEESAIIQSEIDLLEQQISQNETSQNRIEQALASADTNASQESNASQSANNSNQNTKTTSDTGKITEDAVAPSNVNLDEVTEETIVDDEFANINFEQDFNYSSLEAKQKVVEAKKSLVEASALAKQASAAKEAAFSLSTVEERNQAFENANALEKSSEKKQIQAAKYYSEVNQEEFNRNSSLLRQANSYDIDFESSNLDLANLLADEAATYFNQAEQIRSSISDESRLSKVESELQKAYDYEILALRKQGEALKTLQIVNAEYQEKGSSQLGASSNQEPFVQTITDAKVLSVNDEAVAQRRADSLQAEVVTIRKQVDSLETQINDTPVGAERDSLLAKVESLNQEANQLEKKASVYYERKEQLAAGLKESAPDLTSGLIKPAQSVYKTISLDTVEVDDERAQVVMNSQAYVNYVNRSQAKDRLVQEADVSYQEAQKLQAEKFQLVKAAAVINAKAAAEEDDVEKQRLIKEAAVIESQIQAKQSQVDSVNNILKVKNYLIQQAETDMANSIRELSTLEQNEIQKIAQREVGAEPIAINQPKRSTSGSLAVNNQESRELTSNESSQGSQSNQSLNAIDSQLNTSNTSDTGIGNEQTNNSAENSSSANNADTGSDVMEPIKRSQSTAFKKELVQQIPKTVSSTIFFELDNNESAYDSSNPIPEAKEEDLPEGVIYKVQVGAFRNPISQDLFKGFAPIMVETTQSGIKRYTAGFFLNEGEALSTRNKIRNLGYSDAFVVAFLNGERISISRAREYSGTQAPAIADNTNATTTESNSSSQADNSVSAAEEAAFNKPGVQASQNVNQVDGLFFTVQIGVFSKPVSEGTFTYDDLYVKPLAGGLIRYNAGRYQSAQEAEQAKNNIVTQIKDAFITAYYQGKRISLTEAARIQNR